MFSCKFSRAFGGVRHAQGSSGRCHCIRRVMLALRRTCSCRPDSAAAAVAASVPTRLLRVAPIRHTHGVDVRCAAVGSGEGFEGTGTAAVGALQGERRCCYLGLAQKRSTHARMHATEDYQAVARQLNALMARPNRITGRELRELVFQVQSAPTHGRMTT